MALEPEIAPRMGRKKKAEHRPAKTRTKTRVVPTPDGPKKVKMKVIKNFDESRPQFHDNHPPETEEGGEE